MTWALKWMKTSCYWVSYRSFTQMIQMIRDSSPNVSAGFFNMFYRWLAKYKTDPCLQHSFIWVLILGHTTLPTLPIRNPTKFVQTTKNISPFEYFWFKKGCLIEIFAFPWLQQFFGIVHCLKWQNRRYKCVGGKLAQAHALQNVNNALSVWYCFKSEKIIQYPML